MPAEIRVLHVDDHPVALSLFENFLEGEDDRITTETATSGHEALELLSNHEFDCIVSDYDMSGMDGIELLETVRQEYPDLPFILFTGKGTEEVASEAIRKGVTDYLQKNGLERYDLLANRIKNVVSEYQASRELAETRQRLELALAEAEAGVWEWDIDTDDLYWSEELLYVLEYSRDEFPGTIEFLNEKLHPDDAERTEEAIETALQTGDPYRVEQRVETAAGEYRWLDVRGQVIDDQGGRRMIGVGFDITEYKEREQELARERNLFETLTNGVPDVIYRADPETLEPEWVNDSVEDVFGYTAEEWIENPDRWRESIHPEDESEVLSTLQRVKEREEDGEQEYRVRTPDGETKWVRDRFQWVRDSEGNVQNLLGVERNITERKEREQKLQRRNERFQYVEEVADIGYWEIDTQTSQPHDITLTDGVYHIHDLSPDEPFDVEKGLEFYHPEDRPKVEEDVTGAISGGEPYDHEVRLITATGRERWVHSVGEPVERDGEIVKVRGVFQDVTERKQQETALARQNERLDQFASVVSHDLRNPLSVAAGRLDLAAEECESSHLDHVARAHDRMEELIEDLLQLARQGQPVDEFEDIQLAHLVESCWSNVATKEATLLSETSNTIQGDRSRLQQLLENLIRNAVEHSGEEVSVRVGDLETGFYLEDDGPGIPESEREAIFGPGYSSREDGTGFGLAIVSEIIDAHGWEIEITESENGGGRFEITGVEVVT